MQRRPSKKSRSRRQSSPFLSWGWLILGVFCGIAGASMIFWWAKSPKVAPVTPAHTLAKTESKPVPGASSTTKNFDFYTLLPNMEVSVPSPSTEPKPPSIPKDAPAPLPVTKNPPLKPIEKKAIEKKVASSAIASIIPAKPRASQYMIHLQVLTDISAADALKARLTLQNFNTQIQKIQLPNGQSGFRVEIGPFSSTKIAEQQKKRLETHKIYGSLIVKQSDDHQ